MSLHAYAPRDSPSSHTLLDQNLDPAYILEPFDIALPSDRDALLIQIMTSKFYWKPCAGDL